MYLGNYGLPKTWLDKCLKSPVSDYPSKSKIVNAPKSCSNLKNSLFSILIITGKSIVLQKVSISDLQNLKTLS